MSKHFHRLGLRTVMSAVLGVSFLLIGLASAQVVGKKQPAPEKTAQEKALREIKEIHDYAKAVSAVGKVSLARTMIEQARQTKDDPVGAFVLLSEARGLAAAGQEADLAWSAIEELAVGFDVDALSLKAQTLEEIRYPSKQSNENKELVARALSLMNEAAAEGRFDLAKPLAVLAAATARKTPSAELAKSVMAATKELDAQQKTFDAIQRALATLVKTPDDPEANLLAGRFYCFAKDDWKRGLPLLAKGSNAAIQDLAKQELANPADMTAQVKLADGWWDLSEKEPEPFKRQLSRHAGHWYQRAMPALKGFAKTKVEKRMAVLGPLAPLKLDIETNVAAPVGTVGSVDLLKLIKLKEHVVAGAWEWDEGVLVCQSGSRARVQIPYDLPDEYELQVVAQRSQGKDAFAVGMFAGGARFSAIFDAHEGKASGLHLLDGKGCDTNESGYRQPVFASGKPVTLTIFVTKAGVEIQQDGVSMVRWQGKFSRLSLYPDWKTPKANWLFVGAHQSSYRIRKLELRIPAP